MNRRSIIMISDDEDDSSQINKQMKIMRNKQQPKNKIIYSAILTSDEDSENDQSKRQFKGPVKKETKQKYKSETMDIMSTDEDNDKTLIMDYPKKLINKEVKKESKVNYADRMDLISDDEDNEIVPASRRKVQRSTRTRRVSKEKISIKSEKLAESTKSKIKNNNRKRKSSKEKISIKSGKLVESTKPKAKIPRIEVASTSTNNAKKQTKSNNISNKNKAATINCETLWSDHQLLAENMNLDGQVAKNIINLLNDGSTIPFMARYRRNVTGNMSPDVLREVKTAYEDICHLKQKIVTTVNTLSKNGHLDKQLETTVKSARSLEELEIIFAPFKPEGKRTLAERAKVLGLEKPAIDLLYNICAVNLNLLVDKTNPELQSILEVEKGVVHLIAHKIATDSKLLLFLRQIRVTVPFEIETKKLQTKTTTKTKLKKNVGEKPVNESKFQNYFDFRILVRHIKPHQVLAINRGEHLKVLSVKINAPKYLIERFKHFCFTTWLYQGNQDENRRRIIEEAVKDSYTRLVLPFMVREVRSELKRIAEKASYDVFSNNLKSILLAGPITGQSILGIDPGYVHGCKVAVISSTGKVTHHGVIYPHSSQSLKNEGSQFLRAVLNQFDCSLIALGDGKACRETEVWLSHLISENYFHPRDVKYTIVSEDGASVYSCSAEATKEFPNLDVNIISAVSLARRIQDPLAELVKVEPRHLGVGMYQHDLKKKTLDEALNDVVSECVSFVGVDMNTASQCLLRRIAGLTDKRATEIIKYREKHGCFLSRKQLLEIPGIGQKIFEQCAGFLRVGPIDKSSSDFYRNSKTTKLDQTIIHPESYEVTEKLLRKIKFEVDDIGEDRLIEGIQCIKTELPEVSEQLNTTVETLNLIVDALEKPLNYDLRNETPSTMFFSSGLSSIYDLKVGSEVQGRVKNVTHFGCFVDIGIGTDCLIHSSKLGDFNLQIGDRIQGIVCSLDVKRQRVGVKPTTKC